MNAWLTRAWAEQESAAWWQHVVELARRPWLPYREVRFWATQGLVVAIAAVHVAAERFGLLQQYGPLYFVPVSLFFIPTVYAAVNFGIRGSMATALWCTLISVPNLIAWHSGFERWGYLILTSMLVAVAAFVGNAVDEQRRARARVEEASRALEVSESKYRGLFETAGEGVLLLDRGGRIVDCNAAAGALLHGTPRALCDRPLAQISPAPLASALLEIARGASRREDIRLVGSDGQDIWVEPVSAPLAQPDGLIQVVLRDITERKRRQAGLETYAAQILHAQEEERRRMAQELHDETVQSLVLLCRKLDAATDGGGPGPDSAKGSVQEAREYAEALVASLRGFIRGLRPHVLEDLGLVPALRKQLEEVTSQSLIDGKLIAGPSRRLAPNVELALFRIAQEALRNVERHSDASQIRVTLDFGPGETALVIADDGKGFLVPPVPNDLAKENKLGLLGMRERARVVGGSLDINSAPGFGTEVIARVPC